VEAVLPPLLDRLEGDLGGALRVPLAVDVLLGPNWGAMTEWEGRRTRAS
jgi:hypothetical protein